MPSIAMAISRGGHAAILRQMTWWLSAALLLAVAQAHAVTYTSASEPFNWIDASTHTKVGPNTLPYKFSNTGGCGSTAPVIDDSLSDNIPIGFTFSYGGVGFTQLRIMTNGRLQFNNNTTCGFGSPVTQLPYPNAGLNYTMRIYGNDLDPTAKSEVPAYNTVCADRTSCYVSFATIGAAPNRRFVVTWFHVPEWTATSTASGSYDLQVILEEGGDFVYQFGNDVPGPGNVNAQVGWQVDTSDFTVPQVGFPAINSAIRFSIPQPVAEYVMQQNSWSGTTGEVLDTSGNNHHGVRVGSAQTVPGGFICRGADIPTNANLNNVDAINTGISVPVTIGGAGTISFWYKPNNWASNGNQDAQLFDATAASPNWFFLTKRSISNSNVRLRFVIRDSAGNDRLAETGNLTNAVLDANGWVHVAVSWNFNALSGSNQDYLRIYVNGVQSVQSAFTTAGTIAAGIGVLYLGDNPGNDVGVSGTARSAAGVLDEVRIYNYEGGLGLVRRDKSLTGACPAVDHYELSMPSAGVACQSIPVTVTACADATSPCTNKYAGVSGQNTTLSNSGGALAASSLTFDVNGVASTTFSYPAAADGATATVTLSSTTTAATNATRCCPDGVSCVVSNSCASTFNAAGFIVAGAADGAVATVPPQVAGTSSSTYYLRAVKTNTTTKACEAALSGNNSVDFGYECNDPSTCSSSNLMSVNGGASTVIARNNNGSVGSYTAVGMTFDANGNAPFSFNFGDVGQVRLHARKAAGGSLLSTLTGATNAFVVAPASFSFSGVTAGPIKAGNNFSATVTALSSTGATTPNFGKESTAEGVTLSFSKCQPTGAAAVPGTFGGSVGAFNNGAASTSDLHWSEVGNGDLTATLTSGSYLGSGLPPASGNTGSGGTVCNGAGNVGRFVPDHFDTVVTQGCAAGSFTYSGQPFTVQVTARNLGGATTQNYDGSANTSPNFSKVVTLSDANGVAGSLVPNTIAASAFAAGVASANPAFAFTSVTTAPATIRLHAVDTDNVASSATEGTAIIRGGRVRLASNHGSELLDLPLSMQAQYWNGNAWVLNGDDTCTTGISLSLTDPMPADGLATGELCIWDSGSPGNSGLGCVAAGTAANRYREPPTAAAGGDFNLNLRAPGAGNTGPMNVTATVPGWLQFDWTGAGKTNPAARATFGLRKTPIIYLRENF